nr:reverse transcriptase [Tanacetum cinerariifolium]
WSPPTYGEIKINGDAGVGNDGVADLGFVIRSHTGAVLVAGSRRVNFATLIVEAEAKACLWAIQLALAKGFTRVVLESDSSILVEEFKHDKVLVHIRSLFSTYIDYASHFNRVLDTMAPHNAPSQAWSPPTYGEIKINGDVGVGNDGVADLGFVIRSHTGAVLVA